MPDEVGPDDAQLTALGRDFAVVASLEDGLWELGRLPDRLVGDLAGVCAALRQQPGDGVCLALLDVADDFFVAVRTGVEHPRFLLSDVSAAQEWPLARAVLDRLGVHDTDGDAVLPAGDLSIFTDLGMDEMELGAILADLDAYADEMLFRIADRLGFGTELGSVVDVVLH